MERAAAIRAFLTSHREDIVNDTLTLVRAQSPTSDRAACEACADAVEALLLKRLGASPAAVYPQERNGRHLYYVIGEGRRAGLLIGHYDTVWNIDALPLVIDENRIAGPGVYDMKYGIVAAVWSLLALRELGLLDRSYGLFFNSDEEIGSGSSRPIFEPVAREWDNVLVLEPATDGALKSGRKGVGAFDITVHGVAAHAGNDYEKGRSAILAAAKLIETLHGLTDLSRGTTVNVGIVSGGTKRNVVAAEAELTVDFRVCTAAEGERIVGAINALAPDMDGVRFDICGGINRPPFEFTEVNQALYRRIEEAGREMGIPVSHVFVGGGSDGNFTSAMGIPTLDGFGAVGTGAHADYEHILIDESIRHTGLLCASLLQL